MAAPVSNGAKEITLNKPDPLMVTERSSKSFFNQ